MSSFHIINFGCRATQADGGEIEREMLSRDFARAGSAAQADVVVLNTCTVTAAADRDARQTIRRVQRENPRARIVVTGCYAQRAPEELRQIPGIHFIIGNSHKQQLAQIVDEKLGGDEMAVHEIRDDDRRENRDALSCTAEVYIDAFSRREGGVFAARPYFGATEHTRPSLKIQDGCDANCSFCVIPSVRGRSRSLSPEEVRRQVTLLAAEGYQEIVLSGIHLGSYGRDLAGRASLLELMRSLELIPGVRRLRLSSIEPLEVSDEIVRWATTSSKAARHFHIPLQSGDDALLHSMRRPYTSGRYAELVEKIRRNLPDAAIGADVITGFPGESDGAHLQTFEFIERSPLTYLHVFSFSARPGTPAASMRGAVSPQVIKRRSAELRDLGKRKKFKFQQEMIGKTLSVITLERGDERGVEAMSDNFLEVKIAGATLEANRMVDVKIEDIREGMLTGSVCRG